MRWINSCGGPLIILGLTDAKKWKGSQGSSTGSAESDYDRACAIPDYLGVIEAGFGEALVLGDEPLQSAFIHIDGLPAIVRWISCDSEHAANTAMKSIPKSLPEPESSIDIFINSETMVLMDSCDLFDVSFNTDIFKISHGKYRVTTEFYQSSGIFDFLIHRFRKLEDGFKPEVQHSFG